MTYRTINPTEARALIDEGWIYLDVRTVEEFARGHAEGAYNVPFAVMSPEVGRMAPNPDFIDVVSKQFDRGAQLVVACAMGGRSMHACEVLAGEGFENLVNMHGGFSGARDPHGNVQEEGWEGLGYPTSSEPHPDRTYERLRS